MTEWYPKIQLALTKAYAIYPDAELTVEVSELMRDYLISTADNLSELLKMRLDESPKTETLFGLPMVVTKQVDTFRVRASFFVKDKE